MSNLRSKIIQQWWPSTQSLDLVDGSIEKVAAAVHEEVSRFLKGETVTTSWQTFPNLNAAFGVASEFTNVSTIYLVLPAHSNWTVLWNNSFLCDGYDSLCWCLTRNHGLTTIHWSAHDEWTTFQSGAKFVHRRLVDETVVERSVTAAQEDKRWHFYAIGDPLPEEDLLSYTARRKRDRLNEESMTALLSRLGAYPWQEQFYAVSVASTFVLRRDAFSSRIIRRSLTDVLWTDLLVAPIDGD